jgi:hypothetical protein
MRVPFIVGGNPTPTCAGPDCRSSLGVSIPPIPLSKARRRLYWYNEKLDR